MYILIIILLVDSQFNPYTDIQFKEFKSKQSCMIAKSLIKTMSKESQADIKIECVKK